MRRPKIQPIRNKLDITDRVQVRVVTRRLGVSQAELTALVGRIGNSIAAISKEVNLQRSSRPAAPAPEQLPPAAVIASVETAVTELGGSTETPG